MVLNQKCQNKVKSYLRSSTAASYSAAASMTAKEGKKSQEGWIKCAGAGTGEQNSWEPKKAPRVNVSGIHSELRKEKRATRLRLC